MTYKVTAWKWDSDLEQQFGVAESEHYMLPDDVVAAIIKHGRAEIKVVGSNRVIEFQNTYD